MQEKRTSSKLKMKQQETKLLEEQTKKMEEKLALLKRQVEEQKRLKADTGSTLQAAKSRWEQTINPNVPLKSYAQQVLAQQKSTFARLGINEKKIYGSKSFEPILKKIQAEKKEMEPAVVAEPPKATYAEMIKIPKQPSSSSQKIPDFTKAKIEPAVVAVKTLQQFLQENYLLEYLRVLQDSNIFDLESLRNLTKHQMQVLGIKPGHQVKIIKRLHIGDQAEIILESGAKVDSGYGDGNVLQEQAPLKQIQEIDENEVVFMTIPQAQIMLQTQYEQKEYFNCYECYRQMDQVYNSVEEKQFCNEECFNKFKAHMQKKCPECKKLFMKSSGIHSRGLWFCSIGCSPDCEQIEQIFVNWQKERS